VDEEGDFQDVYASPGEASYKLIRFEVTQGIARIRLDRPPANVLSVEMMGEINAALSSLEYQRDVKLVVLSGEGKYFCAGYEISDHLGDRAYMMLEQFRVIFENLLKIDKPSLAVVNGPALGAGCMLAAGCDMSLAAASAKFGHPEIKAGVFNTVAAALLPRIVGRKRACEMIFGGASLTAADAEKIGLVTRAVPDEKLDAEVAALVQRFQDGSAPVLQCARRALAGASDGTFADGVRHAEDVYLNQLMATEDAEEGLRAVMAKRKPVWKDR
jgi:cyclohexa-1,5-dienecarbonyl-CoA hydratase